MENYIPFNCCWASQFEEFQIKTTYGSVYFFVGIACILCSFSVNMWTVLCLVVLANKKLWQCVHCAHSIATGPVATLYKFLIGIKYHAKASRMCEFRFRMTCFLSVLFNISIECLIAYWRLYQHDFEYLREKQKYLKIIYCSLASKFIELT